MVSGRTATGGCRTPVAGGLRDLGTISAFITGAQERTFARQTSRNQIIDRHRFQRLVMSLVLHGVLSCLDGVFIRTGHAVSFAQRSSNRAWLFALPFRWLLSRNITAPGQDLPRAGLIAKGSAVRCVDTLKTDLGQAFHTARHSARKNKVDAITISPRRNPVSLKRKHETGPQNFIQFLNSGSSDTTSELCRRINRHLRVQRIFPDPFRPRSIWALGRASNFTSVGCRWSARSGSTAEFGAPHAIRLLIRRCEFTPELDSVR